MRALWLLPLLLFAAPAAAADCAMSGVDLAWTQKALATWQDYKASKLSLANEIPPTIVLFDAQCRYIGKAAGSVEWQAAPHDGMVPMPFGEPVPAAVTSATMTDEATGAYFFAMALPSIWIEAGAAQANDTDFLIGVFLHEFMHVSQVPLLDAAFKRAALLPRPEGDLDDDAVQRHWQKDPVYSAVYEKERNLLFEAANEPDAEKAKALAKQALALMDARQAHFFTGEQTYWRAYDDIFLTMEGVGQWLNYQWQADPKGSNLDPLAAQAKARGRGRWWTQDEGLALFLVVDRFLPGWAQKAFAPEPVLGIELLREAVAD